jgi:hypothetical protein
VFGAKFAVGVNVATEPAATKVTAPGTATPPGAANVKVVASMVAGVIATLNVAERAWLIGTPEAKLAGTVEITVGGVGAGSVLNVHT